jgi:hypothetical protein
MNEEESSLEPVPTSCPVSEKRFHYRNIMEQDTFKKALTFSLFTKQQSVIESNK